MMHTFPEFGVRFDDGQLVDGFETHEIAAHYVEDIEKIMNDTGTILVRTHYSGYDEWELV